MLASGILPEDVYLHCRDKMDQFRAFCEKYDLKPEEVMYFGDDVPDIEVLQAAGCGVCPADAVEEAKAVADIVSTKPGGKGCIREVIEQTLKAQGKWVFDTGVYKKKF
jgi:3-deoxy-D-manno-octulosonate 8-phosphate phosphatase (KDO 8-P phosphatase)